MKNQVFISIIWIIIGYLFGSIPWGLVIGKVFYNKDLRQYGSGNPGGTNAARVLGLHVGIIVILLDALKALLVMLLCNKINPGIEQYVGLAVCFGHCFPIFSNFKGGKAVASSYGYLLGIALLVTHEYIYTFLIALISFFVILLLFRMVSLASMISLLIGAISIFIKVDKTIGILVFLLSLFVIYRHSANIKRILDGSESKIFTKKN